MITEHIEEIIFKGKENYKTILSFCCFIESKTSCKKLSFLHPREIDYFNTLLHDKRCKTYLLGRYAAKRSVAKLGGITRLQDILIDQGIFNQPVVKGDMSQNIQVSISHCGDMGAAIAFHEECPIGVDIELINPNIRKLLQNELTPNEKELSRHLSHLEDSLFTLFWTAKESLSKLLKTGLTLPFAFYEVKDIKLESGFLISWFSHFSQYQTISFRIGYYLCSITYPKTIQPVINNSLFQIKIKDGLLISSTG